MMLGMPTARDRARMIGIGVLVLLVAACGALAAGPFGFGWPADPSLIIDVRLGRVLLAAAAGTALAASGAVLQAVVRNPLADPYLLGVSGGAAVGGSLALLLPTALALAVPVGAFVGALSAALLSGWLLTMDKDGRGDRAVLVGVIVNAFAASLVTVAKSVLPADRAQALLHWLVGSIRHTPLLTSTLVFGAVVVLVSWLSRHAGAIGLLARGDDDARRLGIEPQRVRLLVYVVTSMLVGIVVPYTGLIGFVGLVLPHAVRFVGVSDLRVGLPVVAFAGAAFLPVCDAVGRLLFGSLGTELPVGAVTALVGAPMFAALLVRHLRNERAP